MRSCLKKGKKKKKKKGKNRKVKKKIQINKNLETQSLHMHDHSHACRKPSLFQSKVSWCSVCWQHRIIWVSIHAFCVAFNSFIIFSLFEVFIALKEKRIKQNGLSPRALPEEWKQSASLSRTAPAHRNVTKKRQKQAWIQEKGSLSTPLRIQGLRKKTPILWTLLPGCF